MAEPDIRLLIGASLGGPAGDSAQKIREEIEGAFASKPLKLNAVLDDKSVNAIRTQLQSGFSNVKIASNVGQTIKQELKQAVSSPVNIKFAVDKTLLNELEQQLANLGIDKSLVAPLASEMSELGLKVQSITRAYGEAADGEEHILSLMVKATDEAQNQYNIAKRFQMVQDEETQSWTQISSKITQVKTDYEQIERAQERANKQEEIKLSYLNKQLSAADTIRARYSGETWMTPVTNSGNLKELQSQYQAIFNLVERLRSQEIINPNDKNQLEDMIRKLREAEREYRKLESASKAEAKEVANCVKAQADFNQYLKTVDPKGLREYATQIAEINNLFKSGELGQAQNKVKELQAAFKNLGYEGGNVVTYLQSKIKALFTYLVANRVMMVFASSIREAVQAVKDIDAELTQMQIVTGATDAKMSKFLDNVAEKAKNVASSITDMISSGTVYARLGYDLEDASTLAEYTAMLQNVGNIDVSDAQNAITAIVKAYNVGVNDIEQVMDKLVTVGNRFPISVSELAEGMNNAGSALAAAGNSFEQSLALLAAANTTVQNISKSSTGLRTISARLRNTTTELNALGEAMTDSEYNELVSALTKASVSIVDTNGELRSTYDILKDIAEVYDDMSSNDQAALTELLAGTRQQNIFASVISQFGEASGAMEAMSNSVGAMAEANATYMESVGAKADRMKAAFQEMASTIIDSNLIGMVYDVGTAFAEFLTLGDGFVAKAAIITAAILGISAAFSAFNASSIGVSIANSISGLAQTYSYLQILGSVAKSGVSDFTQWSSVMSQMTSKQLANIVATNAQTLGLKKLNEEELKKKLMDAGVAESTAKVAAAQAAQTVTTKAQTTATSTANVVTGGFLTTIKGLWTAFKMNPVPFVIGAITALVSIISLVNQHFETLRQNAQEAAEAFEQTSNSIEEYKIKINELIVSLNSGNLSEEEAYNVRKELLSIKDELVSMYGDEAKQLDILTMSADEATAALNKFSVAQAGAFLTKNASEIDKAIQEMDKVRPYSFTAISSGNSEIMTRVKEILGKYDVTYSEGAVGDLFITMNKNARDADEIINNLASDFRAFRGELEQRVDVDVVGDLAQMFDYLETEFQKSGNKVDKIIDKYADIYDNAVSARIVEDVDYSALMKSAEEAQDAYNEALASNDLDAQGIAIGMIQAVSEQIANTDFSRDPSVGIFFANLAAALEEESSKTSIKLRVRTEIENQSTGDAIDKVMQTINAFANDEGAITRNRIESYEQLKNNGGSLTGYSNEEVAAFNALETAAKEYGTTISNLIDLLVQLGYIKLPVDNDSTIQEINNLKTALASLTDETAILQTAMEKLSDGSASFDEWFGGEDGQNNLNSLLSKFPDLQDELVAYEAGLISVTDLQNAFNAALNDFNADNIYDGVNDVVSVYETYGVESNKVLQAVQNLESQIPGLVNRIYDEEGALTDVGLAALTSADSFYDFMQSTIDLEKQAKEADLQHLVDELASVAAMAETARQSTSWAERKVGTLIAEHDTEILQNELYAKQNDIASWYDQQISALNTARTRHTNTKKTTTKTETETKEVEEYVAELDKFYKQLQKVQRIEDEIQRAGDKASLLDDTDFNGKVNYHQSLIQMYQDEQDALHELAEARREVIDANIEKLQNAGFSVEYDAENNRILIQNMEYINELAAQNSDGYESLQEATNAYRKEMEDLIDGTIDMVEANRDNSDSWWELQNSIRSAKVDVVNTLKEIVENASNAVDSLQNVYDTLHDVANEFAENEGFISVDAFQSLIDLGPQYMQYLKDENGLLVINEERINQVIAAKTRQLALDSAMSYVERLRLAAQEGSVENLEQLCFATEEATDATWNLVYSQLKAMQLSGQLTDAQYEAALHNIQAIRSLGDTAATSIGTAVGSLSGKLSDMQSGLDDIIKYVMDMLKQQINDEIDGIRDMIDNYNDLIAKKKESLQASKEEANYQKTVSNKLKEIAKLQAKIDALSLDNSREAQAEKAKLLEQMAELQEDLADTQADKALEAQEDSLDKMADAYEEEKEKEISVLEDSISSYQKLYDKAIAYIGEHWETLYGELIDWNTQYGSVLNDEITNAWNNCLLAAEKYGNSVSDMLAGVKADIESINNSAANSLNTVVGVAGDQYKNENASVTGSQAQIAASMKQNSIAWWTASSSERANLETSQQNLAAQYRELTGDTGFNRTSDGTWRTGIGSPLYTITNSDKDAIAKQIVSNMQAISAQWYRGMDSATMSELEKQQFEWASRLQMLLGQSVTRDSNGKWWIGNQELYKVTNFGVYHKGGVAGDTPTLRQNEILAKLEKGEGIINDQKWKGLYTLVDTVDSLAGKFGAAVSKLQLGTFMQSSMSPSLAFAGVPEGIVSNSQVSPIQFGDNYFYGTPEENIKQHIELNSRLADKIFEYINPRR